MVILTEKKAFKEVPDSRENWLHAARALRVSKASINTAKNLHSASKTVQAQYLLYRTHRLPVIHPEDMDLFTMSLDTATAQAANWLSQYAPFNAYVQSVRDESGITPEGPTDPRNLGIFEVPRALQLQAQSVDNTADAEEETVNSGLLALLVALTVKHPSPIGAWMVRRIGLTATFAKDKFVARLDGYLRSVAEGKTAILVEVKRSERARHEPQVSMQETSEIVAWIKETGLQEAEHRPVLLSQDGQEVYLSAISFSREYRRYLDGARLDLPSTKFMQLQPYGPWDITDAGDVKHLAAIIVAMTAKYGA